MRVGLIKNAKCKNLVVAENLKTAQELFGNEYLVYECPTNFGIGDLCYEGTWIDGGTDLLKTCPLCSSNLQISVAKCLICGYEF